MKSTFCNKPSEEGREQEHRSHTGQSCSKCAASPVWPTKARYAWREEFDAYLKRHYFGSLNRRFHVLNLMVRMTGAPRWYIQRRARSLGLTLNMDRRPWTPAEVKFLETMVGHLSSATIAKRLSRPESSVINKVTSIGRSRRVRHGYTVSDLELCLGESHHKITGWINSGWLRTGLQGTHRHDGNGHDIHRIREKDILTFIRNHPQEVNLGKVDQMWFLDLVLLKGRELSTATPPRRTK